MTRCRALLALTLVAALAQAARAEDPPAAAPTSPAPCAPRKARVRASLRAGTQLADLVVWARSFMCEEIRYRYDLAGRTVPARIQTGPITARQARRLFERTLRKMGLALVPGEGHLEVVPLGKPVVAEKTPPPPPAPRKPAPAPVPAPPPPADPPPAPPAPPAASAPQPVDHDAEVAAALDKGIRRRDETHYDIDRAALSGVIDKDDVTSAVRIIPALSGGFKVYSIQPRSVPARLGFQNGDLVRSVNGLELSTPDKALEAYERFRSADHLSVGITRRGQPLTLEYTIR